MNALRGAYFTNRRRTEAFRGERLGKRRPFRNEEPEWSTTAVSELIHCRRHDVHNMEALLLQILEQTGQGGDGCGMYVVEQENTLTACLNAFHRQRGDLLCRDTRMPVVGVRV